MKKVFCVVCALLMLVLCGCEKEPEPPTVLGKWQAEVDISRYLNETAGFDYQVEKFVIRIQLTFNEDGTVVKTFDQEYMDQQQDSMAQNMWDVMMQMHGEDLGVEPEEVERILIESGWNADILRTAMGLDAHAAKLKDLKGYWELEGNRLFIDPEAARNTDPLEISLSEDRFSVTDSSGVAALLPCLEQEAEIKDLLPIVFYKQPATE